MPEIMRQYGPAMVVAVAAVLLLSLLFGLWPNGSGSVLNEVGSRASGQLSERPGTGAGTTGFDERSNRSLPKASLNGAARQGVEFALLDLFMITDSDGAAWSTADRAFMLDGAARGGVVYIESITSRDGTEHVGGLTGSYSTDALQLSQDTGLITFHEAGVYRVRLKVLDLENTQASYTIPVVVDFALRDVTEGER